MNWLGKLFEKTTPTIEKYKEYRKIGKELNHKIMDTCLDPDVFKKSARLLGAVRGDTLTSGAERAEREVPRLQAGDESAALPFPT